LHFRSLSSSNRTSQVFLASITLLWVYSASGKCVAISQAQSHKLTFNIFFGILKTLPRDKLEKVYHYNYITVHFLICSGILCIVLRTFSIFSAISANRQSYGVGFCSSSNFCICIFTCKVFLKFGSSVSVAARPMVSTGSCCIQSVVTKHKKKTNWKPFSRGLRMINRRQNGLRSTHGEAC
jgi:hypothetical protein